MDPKAGALMVGAGIVFAVVGSVVTVINPPDPPKANAQQSSERYALSQDQREDLAEKAFKQIDLARGNYPPLGADPTNYNATITKAYHDWERAADNAYGSNWRSVWERKHAGDPSVCPGLEITSGLPVAACAEVEASKGEIEPLDNMLMKCPSWNDPSGAIFNPSDPEACARRKRALEMMAARGKSAIDEGSDSSTPVTDPDNASAGSGDTSTPNDAPSTPSTEQATDTDSPQ